MPELSTVYAGSPAFAAQVLSALVNSPFAPKAVFTQPDRPKGRGRKLQPNEVKQVALAHNLPVHQPLNFKTAAAVQELAQYQPDFLLVVAYGLLLPQSVLDIPNQYSLNVHASLLPRWRGAAPIERAYMAGDAETGIGIMSMEAGLDTGPVFAERRVPITPESAIDDLEQELCRAGTEALLAVLGKFAQGEHPEPQPQAEEGITYAKKLTAADRQLDWAEPAASLCRRIRAMQSRAPVRVRVADTDVQLLDAEALPSEPLTDTPGTITAASKTGIDIACSSGTLRITRLKFAGKAHAVDPATALNGHAHLLLVGRQLDE